MALHSAQGPKLGIPQMVQSRAQFGFLGEILPLILVVLMYIGFFATSGALAGTAPLGPRGGGGWDGGRSEQVVTRIDE
jgi:NCS1 family nucleobase:cation symporter-1